MSQLGRRRFIASLIAAAGFVKRKCFGTPPRRGFPLYEPECYLSPPEFVEFMLKAHGYEIDRVSFDQAKAVCEQIVARDTIGEKIS